VTVRADLASILAKLGAGSRLEALVVAIRHALIDVPPGYRPSGNLLER
jgi:DNA-binding NarL/FixJ family response regulator